MFSAYMISKQKRQTEINKKKNHSLKLIQKLKCFTNLPLCHLNGPTSTNCTLLRTWSPHFKIEQCAEEPSCVNQQPEGLCNPMHCQNVLYVPPHIHTYRASQMEGV